MDAGCLKLASVPWAHRLGQAAVGAVVFDRTSGRRELECHVLASPAAGNGRPGPTIGGRRRAGCEHRCDERGKDGLRACAHMTLKSTLLDLHETYGRPNF